MKLELLRRWLTEQSTVGELLADGAHLAWVLEDRYRPPGEAIVRGSTCIPCGTYEVVITHSPRFGVDMPLLLNVPGFSGVRVHWGNDAKDTEGCLLVGLDRGLDVVMRSKEAYAMVFQKIQAARARGEIVHIEVKLAEGGVCT